MTNLMITIPEGSHFDSPVSSHRAKLGLVFFSRRAPAGAPQRRPYKLSQTIETDTLVASFQDACIPRGNPASPFGTMPGYRWVTPPGVLDNVITPEVIDVTLDS